MRYILALIILTLCTSVQAHWSFPGRIEYHLRYDHNVSTTGLTYEQMLNLHDYLHESTQRKTTRTGPLRKLLNRR